MNRDDKRTVKCQKFVKEISGIKVGASKLFPEKIQNIHIKIHNLRKNKTKMENISIKISAIALYFENEYDKILPDCGGKVKKRGFEGEYDETVVRASKKYNDAVAAWPVSHNPDPAVSGNLLDARLQDWSRGMDLHFWLFLWPGRFRDGRI